MCSALYNGDGRARTEHEGGRSGASASVGFVFVVGEIGGDFAAGVPGEREGEGVGFEVGEDGGGR